jgi:hypothetical protein
MWNDAYRVDPTTNHLGLQRRAIFGELLTSSLKRLLALGTRGGLPAVLHLTQRWIRDTLSAMITTQRYDRDPPGPELCEDFVYEPR